MYNQTLFFPHPGLVLAFLFPQLQEGKRKHPNSNITKYTNFPCGQICWYLRI